MALGLIGRFSKSLVDNVHTKLDETEIDLSKVTSKLLYNQFKTKKQTPPSAQKKMKNKYPNLWMIGKNLFFTVCRHSRNKNQREINIKYWTILYTTMISCSVLKWLNRLCALFVTEKMNPSNIYFFIVIQQKKNFWLAFSSWISKQNISMETLTIINILFDVFNDNEDFAILNP